MGREHVLAIDQGTTSSRAIVFDREGRNIGSGQKELPQHFPKDGWVEHDPEDIWRDVVAVCRQAIAAAGVSASDIAAIGITNQRETTVLWERGTGSAVHKAIVWQDRRTADQCRRLVADGLEEHVRARTGLVIDAYFSGTKLAWLLDHVHGARSAAERGALAFGTIDSFLLWRLTGGKVHATDATNASRTMLFDIVDQRWDARMLEALRIPDAVLPEVRDCSGSFGTTDPALFGAAIPIMGIAGDQQAATVGQACFAPGMSKSTYGTGCFMLVNTGERLVASRNRLLSTIAYRLAGRTTYALEGSIFVAGAAVQWLRDGLRVIRTAAESEAHAPATSPPPTASTWCPAFTGLGAPHWDPDARGAILGLTRDSGVGAHRARRAGGRRLPDRRPRRRLRRRHAAVARAAPGSARCASTAAWWSTTGCASSWPTCSTGRWSVRRWSRPPHWVRPTSPVSQPGVYGSPDEVAAAWRLDRRFEPAMAPDPTGSGCSTAGAVRWRGCGVDSAGLRPRQRATAAIASSARTLGSVRGGLTEWPARSPPPRATAPPFSRAAARWAR